MSTIPVEHQQPTHSQNPALQRLAASRQDLILLSHLLQASLVVERDNPLRRVIAAHPDLVRNTVVAIVILLSVAIGILMPYLSYTLGRY